jgi:hypothetical protein
MGIFGFFDVKKQHLYSVLATTSKVDVARRQCFVVFKFSGYIGPFQSCFILRETI